MARKPIKDSDLAVSEDDKILKEAQDRFKRCVDWEANFQTLYKDDVKFANADSDNGWQWPRDLKQKRDNNKRPSLTINKIAKYVELIVNDARQNKPSVVIKPVGEETSFKAAQVWEGMVRYIERTSKAQVIYDEAMQSAVEGGIGWWRVVTEYVADDSFDQDIRIKPIRDQLGVYLDPDIEQIDGSDANFGFVFTQVAKEEAENEYPDVNFSDAQSAISGPNTWIQPNSVRIGEYYRIVKKKDELIYMEDEGGNGATFFRSDVPAKFTKLIKDAEDDPNQEVKKRTVMRRKLEWYKIVGDTIVDRRKMEYTTIPLVRVIGQERIIDGQLYRRGHVRMLKDPQRMYNYNSSGQVEYGALATKSPWVGPKKAFEGNETAWNNANVQNAAYLTYNDYDDEAQRPITAPVRPEAPGTSPAFVNGMQIAEHEMDMASGQYQAQQGQNGNEKSGAAIAQRQRQGDTANYHFIDHQAIAIKRTGEIILDMAPHVFDTERVIQILAKDGKESKIRINPTLQKSIEEDEQAEKDVLAIIFNPKVGKYMVEADIGPAYSTQRQEAWNAFVQIITGAPDLINEIGDLMFRAADFPLADKIAERLHNKIKVEKPYLFDDQSPTPAMQEMQEEIKNLTDQVGQLLQKVAEDRLKLIGKDQKRDIDAFDATSKRLTAVSNAMPEVGETDGMEAVVRKVLMQMLANADPSDMVQSRDADPLAEDGPEPQDGQPPVEGAQQAPDGNWYVPDPKDAKRFLRVDPLPVEQ